MKIQDSVANKDDGPWYHIKLTGTGFHAQVSNAMFGRSRYL